MSGHPTEARHARSETVVCLGRLSSRQMPDCDYCDRSFPDQDAYLGHLADDHEGELGRIDRRRVEANQADGGRDVPPVVYYAAGGIVLFLLSSVAAFYIIEAFEPGPGMVHEHGTIEITIDGEQVSFTGSQYTDANGFHFHGSGPRWHMHPDDPGRFTLAEAMDRLGIDLTNDTIAIEGETYDASEPGTNLTILVNGESVAPPNYELHEDDSIEITVETEG